VSQVGYNISNKGDNMNSLNREQKPIAIFSVDQKHLPKRENDANYSKVLKQLVKLEIPHKRVIGVYTYEDGTKITEQSILVETKDKLFIDLICSQHNQECWLYSNEHRESMLKYPNKTEFIGVLTEVSKDEAESLQAYTYCPKQDRYYATIK